MNAEEGRGACSDAPRATDLALGIDGGGSKTTAWLAPRDAPEKEAVLGRGAAAGSNVRTGGIEAAQRNLSRSIEAAFADAEIERGCVHSVCLALAGCGREAERQTIQRWARDARIARRVIVTDDALPILYAANSDAVGAALIAGTGSLALGRDRQGNLARSGGWGPLFGDEGSGYQIALAGLLAAARFADGRGPETALLGAFLDRLELGAPHELISAIYRPEVDRAAIARLADLVFAAAERGDVVAAETVQQAAVELAELVTAVARRLEFPGSSIPLALSGGVLLHHAALRDHLLIALTDTGLSIGPVHCVAHPVAGALRLAVAQGAGLK